MQHRLVGTKRKAPPSSSTGTRAGVPCAVLVLRGDWLMALPFHDFHSEAEEIGPRNLLLLGTTCHMQCLALI